MQETNGRGVDVSIDSTGATSAIANAVKATRSGGQVILYGIPSEDAQMPPFPVREIVLRQLSVVGGNCNQLAWEPLLSLVSNGQFNVRDMITNVFSLEEVHLALELAKNKPDGFIKSVIHI